MAARKKNIFADKRHGLLFKNKFVISKKRKKHSPEEVEAFRKSFRKEVSAEKRRTLLTWILTILLTIFFFYVLIVFLSA
ncbi:hypothetical protein BST97_15410 [Nonlabens spongiae]|uniref:Uncharacterized protein n=2 Tax=Nonlabens spongiae TaxID=331648 RepID=A0A1W6MNT8_9FLAO|nr:hypothetical protein BST97_15410 [Nonlabens spongiae]